jgi:sugar (pentulose or hexulose) kinase
VSTGTAWVVLATGEGRYPSAADGFGNGRHLVNDLWGHFGEVSNGGVSLRWIRQVLGGSDPISFDDMNKLVAAISPGANGARFFPYFNGTNPRETLEASHAAFKGLQLAHGPGELIRAVMEGVVFETVLLIRRYERTIERSFIPIVVGGATKSATWIGILADTLGRDIRLSPISDAACLGAAILARRGLEPDLPWAAITSRMVPPPTVIRPDRSNNRIYADILEDFEKSAARLLYAVKPAQQLL